MMGPLVSIALPTYNRLPTLERAIESALAQTHEDLELVISDNASTDGTEERCRAAAAGDERVRYLRHDVNRGPTENFNALFAAVRGDYVMMLADDDWIDPDYVAACLAVLRTSPDLALVAGQARYHREGAFVRDGVPMQLLDDDPARRVRKYYATVDDNGTFYGLMRSTSLRAAGRLRNVLGNDWMLMAAVAFTGKVRTLPEPRIHRQLDGTSSDIGSILHTFGSASAQGRIPHLVIAWHAFGDIVRGAPVYRSSPLAARLALGAASAWTLINWRSLAFHLFGPLLVRVGRLPGLGWVTRGLDWARRRWGVDAEP
jgi:glycosyltransferase domain-containing protein